MGLQCIISKQNETLKLLQSLSQRKQRRRTGLYVAEGLRLIKDSLAKGAVVRQLLISEGAWEAGLKGEDFGTVPLSLVEDGLFASVTETIHSQGIVALIEQPSLSLGQFKVREGGLYLLVDRVQDPGNLGTIVRTAVAAGVDAIFLMKGSVDPYNNKTVRSTMSAIHALPIYEGLVMDDLDGLMEQGLKFYGTALENALDYDVVDYESPALLIVGNEGAGIDPAILDRCTQRITIPMYGDIESLNLAVATGLCLYAIRKTLDT